MTTTPTFARRAAGVVAIAALLAVTVGCASKARVRHDKEPGTNLKAYTSFAFYGPFSPGYQSLLEQRLRNAAREQLERRNYVYDEREPELRVNYALQVLDKQALQSTPARPGYRGWAGNGVETIEVRQGTLAIDLVDTRRNTLVWRAVAEGRLDAQAMKHPGTTLDTAVGELFARLDTAAGAAPTPDARITADACTRIVSDIQRAAQTRANAAEQDANAWKTVLPFVVIARKASARSTIDYADKQLVNLRAQAAREGC